MKRIFLIAVCALTAFTAKAQNTTDEIQLLQSAYGMDKKQLIVEHMKFTEAESVKFWTIYDKYESERMKLGKIRINNILEYAKNYDILTNEKATELVSAALDNHEAFTKLQRKTFKELSSAITPLRAAQFIQLEVFLETVIRMKIADSIPLVNKLEEKK